MRKRKTVATSPSYHNKVNDESKSERSSRRKSRGFYVFSSFIVYVFAPLFPHIIKFVWLTLRWRPRELTKIVRYDIPWAWAKDSDREVFPEMVPTSLGSNYHTILQEYNEYRTMFGEVTSFNDIDKNYQGFIKGREPWRTQWLRIYGVNTCYASYFPKTMELFNSWEYEAVSIMISRIAPNQTLPAHLGATKLVLRHLMVVKAEFEPEPSALYVGHCHEKPRDCELKKYPWEKEGQEIVFDDSFWHMADNPTNEERIALFTDMKREMRGWREQLMYDIIMYIIKVSAIGPKGTIVDNTNAFCEAAARIVSTGTG